MLARPALTLTLLATLVAGIALTAVPAQGGFVDGGKVEQCGLLPGEGAYSYVKVWNVGCAKAKKVAAKVADRFCGPSFQKCSPEIGDYIRGHEKYREWNCGLKVGYEFFRVRCKQPGKRFVQESAA